MFLYKSIFCVHLILTRKKNVEVASKDVSEESRKKNIDTAYQVLPDFKFND